MNKHSVKHVLAFLLILFWFPGCESFLEERPLDTISPENFYSTEDDAIAAVNGIYNVLRSNYRSYIMRMDEIPTDDAYPGLTANADYHRMDQYTFDAENPEIEWTWQEHYKAISRANACMKHIPEIEMEDDLKSRLLGEASFMRAFFYFKLVRYFGDIPLITEVYSTLENLEAPRDPASEVYELIIGDLEFASSALPWDYLGSPPQNHLGRATRGAAMTLLSKVYLTRGCMSDLAMPDDFEKAATYALQVIESGKYQLEPEYEDVFSVANQMENTEVIFAWWGLEGTHREGSEYTRSLMPRTFSNAVINGEGRSFFLPEKETWSEYTIGDIRRDVNILNGEPGNRLHYIVYYGDTIWTDFDGDSLDLKVEYPHIWKYKDFESQSSAFDNVNFPILRYADVLLMYAEALNYIHDGPTADACFYVNQIRQRARNKVLDDDGLPVYWFALPDYSPGDFSGREEFLEAIMKERRWELMFEGHRRSDLVRWGILEEVMEASGVEYVEAFHALYPIPQVEMDVNSNLSQNNGYD